jgi:hypothetical protein
MDMEYSKSLTPTEKTNIRNLIIGALLLITLSGIGAYKMMQRKNPDLTVKDFLGLNLKKFSMKTLMVGMVSGIIFGFIDNFGLWVGMSALDPIFTKKLGIVSGSNTAAGYGNTFSDGLGAFLGTFIGIMVSEYYDVNIEETPIWADAVGVIIGCLIGVKAGQLIGN